MLYTYLRVYNQFSAITSRQNPFPTSKSFFVSPYIIYVSAQYINATGSSHTHMSRISSCLSATNRWHSYPTASSVLVSVSYFNSVPSYMHTNKCVATSATGFQASKIHLQWNCVNTFWNLRRKLCPSFVRQPSKEKTQASRQNFDRPKRSVIISDIRSRK